MGGIGRGMQNALGGAVEVVESGLLNSLLVSHPFLHRVLNTVQECVWIIHTETSMRTNVVIDDQLMAKAQKASGSPTKKAAIEAGLKLLVQADSQARLRALRGKIKWSGDLDSMRRD
jgi:Arc/MetJ family transcription regulator